MNRQVSSAKSLNRSFQPRPGSGYNLSPYDKRYSALKSYQRDLILEHQRVSKMTRRDLEDQYISIIDEHYALKRENHNNQEKIKRLITKLSRVTSMSLHEFKTNNLNAQLINRSREQLSFEEKLQICIFDLEIQNFQLKETLCTMLNKQGGGVVLSDSQSRSDLFPSHVLFDHLQLPHSVRRLMGSRSSYQHVNRLGKSVEELRAAGDQKELDSQREPLLNVAEKTDIVSGIKEQNEKLEQMVAETRDEFDREKQLTRDLSLKLREAELRKHISETTELLTVKDKLEECKREFKRRLEAAEKSRHDAEMSLNGMKSKLEDMAKRYSNEAERNSRLKQYQNELEKSHKFVEELRERLIESESEKQSLRTQQERFAMLLKESVHQGDRIQVLKERNSILQKKLDDAKATEVAILHSKSELVEKILNLQTANDAMAVALEGFKSRSEYLESELHTEKNNAVESKAVRAAAEVIRGETLQRKDELELSAKRAPEESVTKGSEIVKNNVTLKSVAVNTVAQVSQPSSAAGPPIPDQRSLMDLILSSDSSDTSHRIITNCFPSNLTINPESLIDKRPGRRYIRIGDAPHDHLALLERAAYRPSLIKSTGTVFLPDSETSYSETFDLLTESNDGPPPHDDRLAYDLNISKAIFCDSYATTSAESEWFALEVSLVPNRKWSALSKSVRPRGMTLTFNESKTVALSKGFSLQDEPNLAIQFMLVRQKAAVDRFEGAEIAFGSFKVNDILMGRHHSSDGQPEPSAAAVTVVPFLVDLFETAYSHRKVATLSGTIDLARHH